MDTVTFKEDFWGEKNQGFDVLYHNMKHAHNAVKDLIEFLRDRASLEESYAKTLQKQAKAASSTGPNGTFGPLWNVMRATKDRWGTIHARLGLKLSELAKDVEKYSAQQKEVHKAVKEELNPTSESLQILETSQGFVAKSRKVYTQCCHELEEAKEAFIKAQKEGHKAKELEKLEARMKKLDMNVNTAEFDYKQTVSRQESACKEFENKMKMACQRFQEIEDDYLQKMHLFVSRYLDLQQDTNKTMEESLLQAKLQTLDKTVSTLLTNFVMVRRTGRERPVPFKFEINPVSSAPLPTKDPFTSATLPAESTKDFPRTSSGSGIKKSKSIGLHWKKKKKQKDESGAMSPPPADLPARPVDEEGYSIRPADADRIGVGDSEKRDSDFSSDSEDETSLNQTIKTLRIKPVAAVELSRSGASAGDIKLAKPGVTLVPLNDTDSKMDSNINRSGSHSSLLDMSIDESDSTRLPRALSETRSSDLLPPSRAPSTTAPTLAGGLLAPPPGSRAAAVRASSPEVVRTSTPNSSPSMSGVSAIPLKQKLRAPQPPVALPSPISGSSVAAADQPATSYPIAVACSEQVNALFKEPDARNCLIKVSGDILVSFPMAVVHQMLGQSSSQLPALLLQVSNTANLEQVMPNKHLLEMLSRDGNSMQLKFLMPSLVSYLKKLLDQSPSSSYHNVDILKYQVKVAGGSSLPLTFFGNWACNRGQSTLNVDYVYNSHAIPGGRALRNVQFIAPVSGNVQNMQANNAVWMGDQQRVKWTFRELKGSGNLHADFTLGAGPGQPSPVAALFICEETTLSGINAQLVGSGFRLSLLKKSFKSGKYTAELK